MFFLTCLFTYLFNSALFMESTSVGGLGPLLLSLALTAGVVAFGVLILRGFFEAIKGLLTQSRDD